MDLKQISELFEVTRLYKAFNGTVVNQALPFLHGGHYAYSPFDIGFKTKNVSDLKI